MFCSVLFCYVCMYVRTYVGRYVCIQDILLFMAFSKLISVSESVTTGIHFDQEAENVGAGHIASGIPGTNPATAWTHRISTIFPMKGVNECLSRQEKEHTQSAFQ